MIKYQISSQNPARHYFDVKITIDNPDPDGQQLRMPNWIPGSYMIREFARHIISMQALCNDEVMQIDQIDKSNWSITGSSGQLCIEYKVYARDFSVRGAHLDHTHGYYNGTSVFLEVVGQADLACEVLIEKPAADYCQYWRLATTLQVKYAEPSGFGRYLAEDYDDLIDHPVEMGEFQQYRFKACGVPHDIILTGRFSCDEHRLVQDLRRICEHHILFFGDPAPVDYYQFQVLVVGEGYGGLEHRSSTSLICSRDSLPQPGETAVSERYREFLSLCSHEYFHTWNIKRIKPAVFQNYDLQRELYTELLWAFEGITSYYDDLALLRCGLIKPTDYLELLAQTMTRVLRGKGSTRQSVAASSFNAWTRFYKQDENAQNVIVSYYSKGSLVALCIDLKMRGLSGGRKSLDDVMRALWQRAVEGVGDDDIQQLICDITGSDLRVFLHQLIHENSELPLQALLSEIGVEMVRRVASNQHDKGGKVIEGPLPKAAFGAFLKQQDDGLRIVRVDEDGSAQSAGLAAEDVIVAINGLKLVLDKLEDKLLLAEVGECWGVHAFRRDELHRFKVTLQPAIEHTVVLQLSDRQQKQQQAWLTGK
ncbi:MAG: M61 family metallopeptidase [Gammaproteobacteria bacterium]|nr:M61 family metallopeptidase [Gammaproteobacteria bacterium]